MKRRSQTNIELDEPQDGSFQSKRRKELPRDPWDIPSDICRKMEICHQLYDTIRNFKDSENHLLCEFIVRLPNRRSVPEYYKIISHPIDLIKIQQKLRTDEYTTVPLFIADIRLLIENSKKFYRPSSTEHKRTIALEKEVLKAIHELSNGEGSDLGSPLSPKTVSLKLSNLQFPSKTPPTSKISSAKTTPTASGSGSSFRGSSGAIKGTRSKAWLDEYSSSDDPIKIFFAAVFSYHDSTGEYIAQPFIDLPSKKDYPEYYRIISEPIGLAIIRDQVEAGYYSNLKALQDDLLLMIKNAQYFNEPHSEIYKMAGILRKFIINRCLELERKYKTVEKTRQLKSPSPAGEGGHSKGQGSRKGSTTDGGDDSDSDELSGTESEGGESGEEGKKKLLLRIKRERIHGNKDPIAKILKSKTPPSLRKMLMALYRTLIKATDDGGRVISELFMKRPSSKLYPEYYIVISNPIDFREIANKIKSNQYTSYSEMMDDVELLVNNAITFNEEYSQIHTDALALRAIAQTALEQLQEKWPQYFSTLLSERKVQPIHNGVNHIITLFAVIKNCMDSTGRKIWLSLKEPPPPREGEGYTGRKPIGLGAIAEKVDSHSFSSIDELFNDLCYLFECCCESYQPQSQFYKDAVSLHRIVVTKYNELTNDRRTTFRYPNAPEAVKKLFRDIMKRLMEYKDLGVANGRCLSDVLQHVVVTQESTDDKSKRVFSIHKLYQWVTNGRYSRLDQLQTDILLVLKQARLKEVEQEEELAKASLALEKQYIIIRDEICGSGQLLWSPALEEWTLTHFEEETKEIKEEHEAEEEKEMETIEAMPLIVIPPPEERNFVNTIQHNDVIYYIGEFIYLPPREPHLPPQIVLIESLWTDKKGNAWFDGCWFFRPHETFHVASRKFYEREVFKSDFYSSAQLSIVLGKCCVLFIKDYIKSFPQGFSEEDVYVCESRYIHKHKSIKKIKFWNIQQNNLTKLLPRLTPCSLNKIPSVFITGREISERGSAEPMEQESLSEQIKSENEDGMAREKKSESVETDSGSPDSSGVMEMSFFRDLKEVIATVPNPEDKCTYFEQFCIDDKIFRLGDFVCVRSDQVQPFIARIDRMWTDADDDPWFRGPWFVRVKEVQHVPTKMFYEREVFMSNIQDTNPMRSIIRKCAVLFPTDYVKWRPTEIPELDVFVCDSKYNEVEKEIKKLKNLKQYQLDNQVLKDEIYYLQDELFLWKCHSPDLFPRTTSIPVATPTSSSASPSPVPPPQQVMSPLISVPTASGQVTLTLQQLQSLLSSPLVNQSNLAKLTQQVTPTSSQTSETILAYPCVWEGCQEIFEDSVDLGSHILRSSHLHGEADGSYYCHWSQCHRKKDVGGKPFDSLQKITRHVKEVHLLRVFPQQVPIAKLGSRFHRRGIFIKDQLPLTATPSQVSTPINQPQAIPLQLVTPLAPPAAPIPMATPPPVSLATPTVTPVAITPQQLQQALKATPISLLPSTSSPEVIPLTTSTLTPVQEETITTVAAPPSIFIAPPTNLQKVVHSQIYLNYIERMRNNESTLSPIVPSVIPHPPQITAARAAQWIDPTIIPEGMTPAEALQKLYHHMLHDAVKISNWLDDVQ